MERTEKLDARSLKKTMSRRDFFRTAATALGVGAGAGTAAHFGLNYLGRDIGSIIRQAEEQIRELGLDVQELSGALETRLVEERQRLEQHYTDGMLRIYEELEIATPAEMSEVEQIIDNYKEFEDHYDFAERARIFKDRIDKRLLTVGEELAKHQPKVGTSIYDKFAEWVQRADAARKGESYSPKTKKQIQKERATFKAKLEKLCRIYDTNSDNRRAQGEVLETLNDYLDDANLTREEREFYRFLKDQYQKGDQEENLRHFVENYESYGPRQETLLRLRASLSEAEALYGKIQENKEYITQLQGLLKQGIALKQDVRAKSVEEVAAYREQIDQRIRGLRTSVDDVIDELKDKGYDVETRQDYIQKGTYSAMLDKALRPLVVGGTALAAGLGAFFAWRGRARNKKIRVADAALDNAVARHNTLADRCDSLTEQAQIYKNPDIPDLGRGNDVY